MRAGCCLLVCVIWSAPGGAEPAFARLYKNHAGYAPSCNACHKDGGGTPLNAYGEQFKQAGMGLAAFGKTAQLDADRDGAANAAEIAARANPGSKRSTPQTPGDWLDTGNVIPKEVQAAYPGITAYKPLDAVFTEAEVARAREMGVELGATDENTIYIPVDGRRPVGTAIIVPAQLEKQQLFLLVATDRQLNVTTVRPINPDVVTGAGDPALYADFAGKNVKALPAGDTQSLAGRVTAAVRKAGVMLFVRLKST